MAKTHTQRTTTVVRISSFNKLLGVAFLCFVGIFSVQGAIAQPSPKTIPENATAKESRLGWACNTGYRSNGSECIAILVPENAYLTDSVAGRGWECHYGFEREANSCLRLAVPENAYLNSFGSR